MAAGRSSRDRPCGDLLLWRNADEAPKTTQCDLLAWSPHDPSSLDGGKEGGFWKMDAPAAIAACETALAEQPGIARLQQRYAIALWKANRHDDAITWMRKAADQGFAPALDDLGYLYREDPSVSGYSNEAELNAEALRLQRAAAEQGNIIAMGDVGYCYMSGTGVGRDYGEALKWLRQAVEHDEPYAEAHLGEMYKNGWGVPQDDTEAVKWFRRSADQGYRGGQYNLALMLLEGRGVARDRTASEELLSRAAEHEHPGARRELQRLRSAPPTLRRSHGRGEDVLQSRTWTNVSSGS
jgi:TPR repeat protein